MPRSAGTARWVRRKHPGGQVLSLGETPIAPPTSSFFFLQEAEPLDTSSTLSPFDVVTPHQLFPLSSLGHDLNFSHQSFPGVVFIPKMASSKLFCPKSLSKVGFILPSYPTWFLGSCLQIWFSEVLENFKKILWMFLKQPEATHPPPPLPSPSKVCR